MKVHLAFEKDGEALRVRRVENGDSRQSVTLGRGERDPDSGWTYDELRRLGPGEHEVGRKVEIEIGFQGPEAVNVRETGDMSWEAVPRNGRHGLTGLSFDKLRDLGEGRHVVEARH